jgi:hypothetical protein
MGFTQPFQRIKFKDVVSLKKLLLNTIDALSVLDFKAGEVKSKQPLVEYFQ